MCTIFGTRIEPGSNQQYDDRHFSVHLPLTPLTCRQYSSVSHHLPGYLFGIKRQMVKKSQPSSTAPDQVAFSESANAGSAILIIITFFLMQPTA